jgi:S1-C subfamily serine protease
MQKLMCVLIILAALSRVYGQGEVPELPTFWDKTVVLIEKFYQRDGRTGTEPHGTGFFLNDDNVPYNSYLVTNAHLLINKDSVSILYNKADEKGIARKTLVLVESKSGARMWKKHPQEDIAIVPIKGLIGSDARAWNFSRILSSESLFIGEEVYFFGFPLGLKSIIGKGSRPVLRKGIVSFKAQEPTPIGDEVLSVNQYLIDGFSFGGNSGSPVVTPANMPRKRARLVGIIFDHVRDFQLFIVANDTLYAEFKGDTLKIVPHPDTLLVDINTGLAMVIPAEKIKETLNLFSPKNK